MVSVSGSETSVSSSMPVSAIINDTHTSIIKKIKIQENYFYAWYVAHLANSVKWVSCLIWINLNSHLIQSSALPAGPFPGDNGKPTGEQPTHVND